MKVFKGITMTLLAGALLATSCKKDEEKPTEVKVTVTTADASEVTINGAKLGGTVSVFGSTAITDAGIVFGKTANPTVDEDEVVEAEDAVIGSYNNENKSFSVTVDDLEASTTYYVRAYAEQNGTIVYGEQKTFTTEEITPFWKINDSEFKKPNVVIKDEATYKIEVGSLLTGGLLTFEFSDEPAFPKDYSVAVYSGELTATSVKIAAATATVIGALSTETTTPQVFAKNIEGKRVIEFQNVELVTLSPIATHKVSGYIVLP